MSRVFKIALVLALLALAPLRGFAGVASSHSLENKAAAAHAGHGEPHGHEQPPQDSGHDHASSCMEHCASTALVSPAQLHFPAEPTGKRIGFVARPAPAFIPDPLDPPPLAG